MRKITTENSQTSDRGVYTRSRQLDFGSVDGVKDDKQRKENESGGAKDGVEGTVVKDEVIEEEAASTDRFKSRGRRSPVFWSADEENFLRRGVEKYGIGKWKKILTDGKDVFSSHRTNVDLKDKWTNLSKNTSRKRRKTTYVTECRGNADEPVRNINEAASNPALSKSCREGVVKTECINASATSDEKHFCEESDKVTIADSNKLVSSKSSQVAGSVTLKFATDKSFPELLEVYVNLELCKDVTSLINQLRSSILSDALPEANIQIIALESRVRLKDDELLARCIPANGMEFYLVFEESLEEFV